MVDLPKTNAWRDEVRFYTDNVTIFDQNFQTYYVLKKMQP